MMNRPVMYKTLATAVCAAAMLTGCKEKTPNRDFFPVIKQRVFLLQEAIRNRTATGLDSLLAPDYAERGGADSVVQFAYGEDPKFQFARFGETEIFYTDERARVDGVIVGEDGQVLRDMILIYEHRGDRWLLKRIGPGEPSGVDSLDRAIDSVVGATEDTVAGDTAAADTAK